MYTIYCIYYNVYNIQSYPQFFPSLYGNYYPIPVKNLTICNFFVTIFLLYCNRLVKLVYILCATI